MTALFDRTDRAPEPVAAPEAGSAPRFVPVRVNLLPHEIVAGRRTDAVRRRVLIGIAALVAILIGSYAGSWWQTHTAQNELDAARSAQSSLQEQSRRYAPLVAAKAATSTIQAQLRQLMAGDVAWTDLLTTLRRSAPAGIAITQIDGTVTAGAGSATGAAPQNDPLDTSGIRQIGSLTLTGTARDKGAVADFADALAKVAGFGTPFIGSVNTADKSITWQMDVPITVKALGGRYQNPNGGK